MGTGSQEGAQLVCFLDIIEQNEQSAGVNIPLHQVGKISHQLVLFQFYMQMIKECASNHPRIFSIDPQANDTIRKVGFVVFRKATRKG